MSNLKDPQAGQDAITARCEGHLRPEEVEAFLREVRPIADTARRKEVEAFLTQMAGFSLPEEEGIDVNDLGEERLFGEYATFMETVRWARSLT